MRCLSNVSQSAFIMPAISPDKPYRIGRSRTGLGLFATRDIKKGSKIIRYTGRMLDCNKKKDDAIENKYLFQITSRWTIDGSVRTNTARYVNHACRPNAESDVSKRKRRVVIRAIKNIKAGEEINYDYGDEYFKSYLKPIGCKCDHCEKKRLRAQESGRTAKKGKAKDKAAKQDGKGRNGKKLNLKGKAGKKKAANKAAKGKAAKSKAASTGKAKSSTKKAGTPKSQVMAEASSV
jgi:hypothetical protein